jgi:iron transport multicopper oxidase
MYVLDRPLTIPSFELLSVLEQYPHFLEDDQNGSVVGLCTGGLVTAAYAASSNLEDLQALAVPTAILCFDVGMQADFASCMVYDQGETPESWSMAIADLSEAEAIALMEDYAGKTQDKGNLCSICFLSAVTPNGVSISGPPPALRVFQGYLAREQTKLKHRCLPIYAAYHAPHIHHPVDLSSFLQRCNIDAGYLTGFLQCRMVISPSTGELLGSLNALELFRIAINDTLCAPLRLDRVITQFVSTVEKMDIANIQVTLLPPSAAYDRTVSMLETMTHVKTAIRNLPPPLERSRIPEKHAASSSVPLAIVGMSGRFPGAESVEELWRVLEAGLDMHKTVGEVWSITPGHC